MDENMENVQTEGTGAETVGGGIVIEQPSTGKKILKWVLRGLAVAASAFGGFLLGRSTKDDGNDDSAETEAPKED